jgi:two-component system, response regulator
MPLSPILIVDDDELDVLFTTDSIVRAGIALPIEVTSSGEAAMIYLRERANLGQLLPALILLDIKMPRADGFDTLKEIRSDAALAGVTVVMHSNSDEPRDRERARELGANDYLVKYAKGESLRALIKGSTAGAA